MAGSQDEFPFPRATSPAGSGALHRPPPLCSINATPSVMFDSRTRSPFSLLCCLFLFVSAVNALHFYLDASEKRCFIEEVPSDTVVEGERRQRRIYPAQYISQPFPHRRL